MNNMERNALKDKIKNGEKTIGTIVTMTDPAVARIVGSAGFDFIWIDLEHSRISFETLFAHILAVKAGGSAVIVRVPQDDLTYTKKVLEMGVDGIIFPMIHTAEQANIMIGHTLYPPYGTRGCGPQNATVFGKTDMLQYVGNTKNELARFIQIEHIDAVKNLDEIMKNEEIDGYIFGPYDLSGSIGRLGQVYGEENVALLKEAAEKLKKAGKYIGLATGDPSENSLKFWSGLGVDMIAAGEDFALLRQKAELTKRTLDEHFLK